MRVQILEARKDATPWESYEDYGPEVRTDYWVRLAAGNRWRRVYAAVYHSSTTYYIRLLKQPVPIDENELRAALSLAELR